MVAPPQPPVATRGPLLRGKTVPADESHRCPSCLSWNGTTRFRPLGEPTKLANDSEQPVRRNEHSSTRRTKISRSGGIEGLVGRDIARHRNSHRPRSGVDLVANGHR